MDFKVSSPGGESVSVPATNWLDALGKATGFFNVDASAPAAWSVNSAAGIVEVSNADGLLWTIFQTAPDIQIRILGHLEEDFPLEHKTLGAGGEVFRGMPPIIEMPEPQVGRPPVFSRQDLSEHLFELSGDIAGKRPEEAAHVALGHIRNFVNFADALVIRGALDDFNFNVLLGQGELGEDLVGHEIAFDVGVLGQCHRKHMAVWLTSVNTRRLAHLPERVHPLIESMVLIPIVTDDGWFWGALNLINVSTKTDEAAIEAAALIGRTLATAIRG